MKTSESIGTIAALLLKAQMSMGDAKKGASNPFYSSTYADLNSIREVAGPVLNALEITILQPTVVIDGKNYVETVLLHSSGEFVSAQTAIINDKGTAQAEGSGLSYARRYGLQALLNIGAVDDDAETATGRGKSTSKAAGASAPRSTFRKASATTEKDVTPTVPALSALNGTTNGSNGASQDTEEWT